MFFPIRTDRPLRHTPWMNYTIIGANALIFLLQLQGQTAGGESWWSPFLLYPVDPTWYQFFSYQFLHAGWTHVGFNMLFLYVFGNNLEDRFGPVGYLCFYLAGGVVAGLGHALVELNPVLGASGAVAAVTGAYLALFPRTNITLVWLLIIITFFQVPAMYLIIFSFGWDLFSQLFMGGNVAYLAHLSGYAYGFTVGMMLLATRVLPREPYDFLALVSHWNRRRQFRSLTRGGKSPWQSHADRVMQDKPLDEKQQRIMDARAAVSQDLNDQHPDRALDAYEKLLRIDGDQVMHRQAQLELANTAMNTGRHHTAAHAYELFLRDYSRDEFCDQVHLILGLIYMRYLDAPDRARPHLQTAVDQITDPPRRQMAADMLAELDEKGF